MTIGVTRMFNTGLGLLVATMLVAACGGGDEIPDAGPITIDARVEGTMSLTWSLSDGAGAIMCGDVGAMSVEVREIPNSGATPPLPDVFSCTSGMGTTKALPVGSYSVQIRLKSVDNQMLGDMVSLNTIIIEDGVDTSLGNAMFTVSRTGGVQFKVDSNAPGKNCEPEAMNGAGISTITVELRDDAGNCVPAPSIQATCPGSAQPCATYENDIDQMVTGLLAGDYTLTIIGHEDILNCYHTSASFSVPGGDVVNDIGSIIVPFDMGVTGCTFP